MGRCEVHTVLGAVRSLVVASHRGFFDSTAADDQTVPDLIDAAADDRDLAAGGNSGRGRLLELRA